MLFLGYILAIILIWILFVAAFVGTILFKSTRKKRYEELTDILEDNDIVIGEHQEMKRV